MIRYGDLREARPEQWYELSRAVQAWRGELTDSAVELRNRVATPLLDAGGNRVWSGYTQQGAALRVDNVARTVEQAVDDMLPVADAGNVFGDRIGDLQGRVAEPVGRATERGWIVGYDGSVTIPDGWEIPAGQTQESITTDALGIRDDIAEYVVQLVAADRTMQAALRTLETIRLNVTQVGAADRAVEADAHRAAELAALPPADLNPEQARELAGLLERHGEDPTFADTFYDTLGPRGYLDLAASLGGPGSPWIEDGLPPDQATRLAQRLHDELGATLATATDPAVTGDDAGPRGQSVLDALDRSTPGGYGEQDYVTLSRLLGHGDYSAPFLTAVGDEFIAEDQREPFGDAGRPVGLTHLGGDPIMGLLGALERTPEASSDFFDPRRGPAVDGGPSHVEYLLEHRDWAPGLPGLRPDPHAPGGGYDLLGRALEAGTVGQPRTEESAAVFSETVRVLGDNDLPGGERGTEISPAMRDSLGRMIAGHIDDVNAAYADTSARDDESSWVYDSDVLYPGGDTVHANIAVDEIARILDEVAADPNAYADIHNAQTVYSSVRMHDVLTNPYDPSPDAIQETFENRVATSSGVFGMLNESRAHAVAEEFEGDAAAYNEAIRAGGVLASTGAFIAGGPVGVTAGVGITELARQLQTDPSVLMSASYADTHEGAIAHVARLAEQAMFDASYLNPAAGYVDPSIPRPDFLPTDPTEPVDLSTLTSAEREEYDRWATGERRTGNVPFDWNPRDLAETGYYNGIDGTRIANGRGGAPLPGDG